MNKIDALHYNYSVELPQNAGTKAKINDDEIEIFNGSVETTGNSKNEISDITGEKVSFKEGAGLVLKGFVDKAKNIATSIVKHPVKTAIAVAGTCALISAAPLVGISCATAGAFLALGFGAFAIGKTAYDVCETVKDNKEGKYNEVREDLQNIGGDGVDLALTLPFMPKAVKQAGRFAKYGTSTVGLNTELISNLSACKNFKGIQTEFAKADTLINYNMIGNEMGLAVKPEIEFYKQELSNASNQILASYEPTTGKIYVNENILSPKAKLSLHMQGETAESVLRHELEHFRQFGDIAKAQGIEGVKSAIMEYYQNAYKAKGGKLDIMSREDLNKILEENSSVSFENVKEAVDDCLKALEKEFEVPYDQRDFTEFYSKVQHSEKVQAQFDLELAKVSNARETYHSDIMDKTQTLNSLQNDGLNKDIIDNMLFGDQSKFNGKLYQDVINSQGAVEAGSAQAAKASEYAKAFSVGKTNVDEQLVEELAQKYDLKPSSGIVNFDQIFNPAKYQKFQLELYKTNLLEKEAYTAQDIYKANVTKMRPGITTDAVMAASRAEDYFSEDDKSLFDASLGSLSFAKYGNKFFQK